MHLSTRPLLRALAVAFLAAHVASCMLEVETQKVLALVGEANSITLTFFPGTAIQESHTVSIEGGLVVALAGQIDVLEAIMGGTSQLALDVREVHIAGDPATILGSSTEEICLVFDDQSVSVGTLFNDFGQEEANFDLAVGTRLYLGNEALTSSTDDGFPFDLGLSAPVTMGLGELLSLLLHSGDFAVDPTFEDQLTIDVQIEELGVVPVDIQVDAAFHLETAPTFPSGTKLDDCITFFER